MNGFVFLIVMILQGRVCECGMWMLLCYHDICSLVVVQYMKIVYFYLSLPMYICMRLVAKGPRRALTDEAELPSSASTVAINICRFILFLKYFFQEPNNVSSHFP